MNAHAEMHAEPTHHHGYLKAPQMYATKDLRKNHALLATHVTKEGLSMAGNTYAAREQPWFPWL